MSNLNKTLSIVLVLVGVGCHHHLNAPNVPATIKPTGATAYSRAHFNVDYAAYQDAVAKNQMAQARVRRDAMVDRIEVDVEDNYRDFEAALAANRAKVEVGSDIVELGISAATGVVGSSDVKDLLSASLTAFKGTRLSFDKNVFRERTTEILISQMQASREGVRNRITLKISTLDVAAYSFEEAWRDLVEFFYAGTLQAALQQLANDTGKAAADEKQKAAAIDVTRANTAEEAQAAIRIRQNYATLAAMAHDADVAKQDAARKQLQQILSVLGEKDADKITDLDALLSTLRSHIREGLTDPSQIPALDKALTLAPQP